MSGRFNTLKRRATILNIALGLIFLLSTLLLLTKTFIIPKLYVALGWIGSLYFMFWSGTFLLLFHFYDTEKKSHVIDYLKKLMPGIGTGLGVAVALELKGADILSRDYWIKLAPVLFVFVFFVWATGKMYIFLLELEEEL